MTTKDLLKQTYTFCDMIVREYVKDLSDQELLVRSVPQSNHIAWQLGHLIGSTHWMLTMLGQEAPALPEGFTAKHEKEQAGSDEPGAFYPRDTYVGLMDSMKTAVLATIDRFPEKDLDAPGPEPMRSYCPTNGAVLSLLGTHWLMHAGQFVPIRRKLGRPAMF